MARSNDSDPAHWQLVDPEWKTDGDGREAIELYCPTQAFRNALPPQARERDEREQTNVYVTFSLEGGKPVDLAVTWVKTHDTDPTRCARGELSLPEPIKEAWLRHPEVGKLVEENLRDHGNNHEQGER